jgi:hypothetical protein
MRDYGVSVSIIIVMAFIALLLVGYAKNIIKLSECDFEAPYKAEVIHSIGLIPVVGVITGWIDVGK